MSNQKVKRCKRSGSKNVDSAHQTALEKLQFVSTVKVPYLLACLGFTEKMCLDLNVARTLGMEEPPDTNDVHRYEQLCQEVQDSFPTLREEIDPYHIQWLIFDWQRYNGDGTDVGHKTSTEAEQVTDHETWFNAVFTDVSEIQNIVNSVS